MLLGPERLPSRVFFFFSGQCIFSLMPIFRYLSLVLLIIAFQLSAQHQVSFLGEVRDTLGLPAQFANVMAVDTATQTMAGFAVTNAQGQFKLRLTSEKAYLVKVTFIGFKPLEQLLTVTESNADPFLFVLRSDVTELGAVEIVAEMPVTFQGDTITYKADAFTQGNERKLEDLLEDLPGFEIEENGDIKVQGKKVDKVLVDGKEFFNGDSKLATKNIPASVVDRVQLLQNFNEISPLRNVNGSEELAINVQLKEDKKTIVFGDLTAGAGDRARYFGHANAFYYDQKTNLNLIADANNIGQPAFTMSDYFRFAGGLGSMMQGRGSNFSVSSDQSGIPMAERNSAKTLDNQLAAFNFSLKPSYAWRISGFTIGSLVSNGLGSLSRRTYLQEAATLEETLESSNFVKSRSGIGKLGLQYAPNYNLHLSFEAFVRNAQTRTGGQQSSAIGSFTNKLSSEQKQTPWAIEQKLSGYYAMGEKTVFSMETSHQLQFQDPHFQLRASQLPFAGVLPLVEDSTYVLSQRRQTHTKKSELLANYYRILNRTNHLNFSAGYSASQQDYRANLWQVLADEFTLVDSSAFRNRANLRFSDAFAGVTYRTKLQKFTFSPQLNLHSYHLSHLGETSAGNHTTWLILPAFSGKYEIRSSQTIHFNYRLNANFMDVQQVVSNVIVDSYNALTQGNPQLMNSQYHDLSADYRNFNMYSFFNIYGGVSYRRTQNDIQDAYTINKWERISLPINIDRINHQASGYLNVEKRFNKFKLSAEANWSLARFYNQLGEVQNLNTNIRQTYKGLVNTTLWERVSLRVSQELSLSEYAGNQSTSRFINQETATRINWKVVGDLRLIADYAYNNYHSLVNRNASTYDLLDLSLQYRKEGSPWEFSLKGLNMLNTTSIRRDSFSANVISTYSYEIQRRYVVLMVMWDL